MSFNVGYTNTPSDQTWTQTGQITYCTGSFTMSAVGTLQSVSFYFSDTGGGTTYLGVYQDSSGKPGTLLGQTASFTPTIGWKTVNTTTNPLVANGTVIWCAILSQSTAFNNMIDYPYNSDIDAGPDTTLPSSFVYSSQQATVTWGIYATFNPPVYNPPFGLRRPLAWIYG